MQEKSGMTENRPLFEKLWVSGGGKVTQSERWSLYLETLKGPFQKLAKLEFLWPDGDAPDFSSMMDHFYFEDDMESITDAVSYDKYAIGYNIISYLDWAFENGYIDLVAIDGVVPKTETFKDHSYPYITTAYVAIRADEPSDSPARMLYDWIGSEKSIELIADNSSLNVDVGDSEILKYDS